MTAAPRISAPAAQAAVTPRPLPRGEREGPHADGGLDVQARRHGGDLLQVAGQHLVGDDHGHDREQQQHAEDGADPGGRVADRGGDAEGEQRDQREVKDRAADGPQVGGVAKRQGNVAVRRRQAPRGQDQPSGERRAAHGEQARAERGGGCHQGLGRERGEPAGGRRQRDPDHPGAVLAADRARGEQGDDYLAEVDAGEADLHAEVRARLPWRAGARQAAEGRGRGRAHRDGERGRGEQQPPGARERAELGPLRVQGAAHASLLRSRYAARASAAAVQAASTPRPASGDSGKYPEKGA